MLNLKNKFENLFKIQRREMNEADLQEFVLGKIFPTIRYGRDSDLERYITLREGGKSSTDWQVFYDNLSIKYTDQERKQLIRSIRKNLYNFNLIFNKIIGSLYKRVINILKGRIDQLVKELKKIEKISKSKINKDHNMLARVEAIIQLCSRNKSEALDGIHFLLDLAQNLNYKHKPLAKIQHIVKSYFDGTLFEEAEAKIEYHFDIKEEYKKHRRIQPKPKSEEIKLKIFITKEDISQILVDDKRLNEYELSLSYFEKYFELINDPEFATKIYVFSKKHNTPHYKIFEAIRKGMTYNYQKNRVFDDIFKIICQGRYVFNITNEKQIDKKLKTIGRPIKLQPEPKKYATGPLIYTPPKSTYQPPPQPQPQEIRPEAEKTVKTKPRKLQPPLKRVKPSRQTTLYYKDDKRLRSTHTIEEMIGDLNRDKKIRRFLHSEFLNRLPSELTRSLGFKNNMSLNDDQRMKQLRDLIHYVQHNYDSILSEEKMFAVHKDKIEGMDFPLHTIYTVILNCFNTLKSDFLTGSLAQKRNKSLFKRFKLF
ncbi:MAG: hypothetical protein JW822_02785 [Spirochaetales bacterium]|nr:hypothetical protein [Spirochaetales bacterium]